MHYALCIEERLPHGGRETHTSSNTVLAPTETAVSRPPTLEIQKEINDNPATTQRVPTAKPYLAYSSEAEAELPTLCAFACGARCVDALTNASPCQCVSREVIMCPLTSCHRHAYMHRSLPLPGSREVIMCPLPGREVTLHLPAYASPSYVKR